MRQSVTDLPRNNQSEFKKLPILIFFLLFSLPLLSQPSLQLGFDIGENNVSDGVFLTTFMEMNYRFGKYTLEGGMQMNIISNQSSDWINAGILEISRKMTAGRFLFDIHGYFLYNAFSALIHESNFGLLGSTKQGSFKFKLGWGLRVYRLTNYALETYNIQSGKRFTENLNLLYSAGYQLKPDESKWNLGLCVTNLDNFTVSQETNPMLALYSHYKVSTEIHVFAEALQRTAGIFNISANHFGILFRSGIVWNL